MFQTEAPLFQDSIKKSGYDFTLKFDPSASNKTQPKKKKRSRKDNTLWFNPPYNHIVTTNVGKEFLNLVDQCFPPGNPLRKIFNRNNVKISYSTTPNMAQIISGKNQKLLGKKDNMKTCSCPKDKKPDCPLAVLPFGPFFPDFGPDPDFFQEIGPEMVRICIKKSGFDQKWKN